MRDRDTISDLLKDTYKKYSDAGDPEKNINYITNMLQLELLCDIRDLLSDIRASGKFKTVKERQRPLH